MHNQLPPSDIKHVHRDLYAKSIHYNSDPVKPYTAGSLGDAAHDAVMLEIGTTPKPGLVDRNGCGCHSDMDFDLFARSAKALRPFWMRQAKTGLDGVPPPEAMRELRPTGREMEEAMFAATDGINTHKGLIYLLSLLLYGAGRTVFRTQALSGEEILVGASLPVAGSVEKELHSLKNKASDTLTNGEKLFLRHGVTGVRGEAERGLPAVRLGVDCLRRSAALGATQNNAAITALLQIMACCEDSNVIHRAGYAFWQGEYRQMVRTAMATFDVTAPDYTILRDLEDAFLPLRISPGGAADLLCCSLFVNIVTISTCQQ